MHRFFIPPEACHNNPIRLSVQESKHARSVLRLREGDRVVVLNGAGKELLCQAEEVRNDFRVTQHRPGKQRSPPALQDHALPGRGQGQGDGFHRPKSRRTWGAPHRAGALRTIRAGLGRGQGRGQGREVAKHLRRVDQAVRLRMAAHAGVADELQATR